MDSFQTGREGLTDPSFSHILYSYKTKHMTRTPLGKIYRKMIPTVLDKMTNKLNKHLIPLVGTDLDGFSDTVSKTKFLAMVAPLCFEEAAKWHGYDYKFVNENGYDTVITYTEEGAEITFTIEDKMSLMESTDSFATGNNHSKVKDHIHFVMKLQNVGNIFTSVFAALIDVPALSDGSGWDDSVSKTGNNNNGFSSLKILKEDSDKVEVIYGKIRSARKYLHTEYEILDA